MDISSAGRTYLLLKIMAPNKEAYKQVCNEWELIVNRCKK